MRVVFNLILLITIFFTGCKVPSNIYIAESNEPLGLYSSPAKGSRLLVQIPPSSNLLIFKKQTNYSYVVYQNHRGVIVRNSFKNYRKFGKSDGNVYGYTTVNGSRKHTMFVSSSYQPVSSTSNSNSSNYAPRYTPAPTYTGGEVQVRGYYRKDGTYVRPHTRSAPKRRN